MDLRAESGGATGSRVRPFVEDDWPAAKAIYLEGIATGNATFQTAAPNWEDWNAGHLAHSRLVLEEGSAVVGWAALSPVSARAAYRGVAEVSIYVCARSRGRGHGISLLHALTASADAHGIWTLQAGIFPENVASCKLHERCGFRLVGRRERIGLLDGRWRDVLLYERRSMVAGV